MSRSRTKGWLSGTVTLVGDRQQTVSTSHGRNEEYVRSQRVNKSTFSYDERHDQTTIISECEAAEAVDVSIYA